VNKTLEITVAVGCPYKCDVCPQPALVNAYRSDKKVFNFADFKSILYKVPRDVCINFAGFTEPFYHPRVHEMMSLVRFLQFSGLQIFSTLMGLREDQINTLKLVRPDYFHVHVPDTKSFVVSPTAWKIVHDRFLSSKLPATYMTMGALPEEIRLQLAIHRIPVETPDMLSRGGSLWISKDIKGPICCAMERWHSNVLLPNGDVYGCCMDFGLTVRLGNLLSQPYSDIFTAGETWRTNMERDATGTICSRCEWSSTK
jgi:radical SAM protein with 4Fe4S-binding SPASM domain